MQKGLVEVAQVVEYMSRKYEALSLNPSTEKVYKNSCFLFFLICGYRLFLMKPVFNVKKQNNKMKYQTRCGFPAMQEE
jgi:hypothetical protein